MGVRGKREIIHPSLHCHHQNDFCIKVGSDGSHFNVSFIIVTDKVTRQCPQTTTFKEKGEPKRIRTGVPLLTRLTPYRSPVRFSHGPTMVSATSSVVSANSRDLSVFADKVLMLQTQSLSCT